MLILGKHCPDHKGLSFTLQSVFGVNQATANKVCAIIGVQRTVPLEKLFKVGRVDKLNRLCRDYISTNKERQTKTDIKRLLDIKHYKGIRHMFGLPARGQRTRTNASTSKRLAVVKHLNPQRSKAHRGSVGKKQSAKPNRSNRSR